MKSRTVIALFAMFGLAAITGGLWHNTVHAGPILYEQTILTGAVANADLNFPFTNCIASEGCMGKPGLVIGDPGSNPLNPVVYDFSLSAAEVTLVTTTSGTGSLSVVAARDIGHRVGLSADDFLVTTVDTIAIGDLFKTTIDTCPPGERGTNYSQTLVCGPNFHTDLTASDSLAISTTDFQAIAADGSVQAILTPSTAVGRLKIFSVTLRYEGAAVPEPTTLLLLGLGLAGLGFARTRLH